MYSFFAIFSPIARSAKICQENVEFALKNIVTHLYKYYKRDIIVSLSLYNSDNLRQPVRRFLFRQIAS